jgi:hypothetical protein
MGQAADDDPGDDDRVEPEHDGDEHLELIARDHVVSPLRMGPILALTSSVTARGTLPHHLEARSRPKVIVPACRARNGA